MARCTQPGSSKAGWQQVARRQFGERPQVLPGPTAGSEFLRTVRLIALVAVALPAFVVQAYLPYQGVWVTGWAVYATVMMTRWVRGMVTAVKRQSAEIARGYTTVLHQANVHPALFLLDLDTVEVLSGPGERRPEGTRRTTLEAWRATRSD